MIFSEKTITEFIATSLVVISVFIGTTTYYGTILQFVFVGGSWWWMIYRFKLYGYVPAQIALTIVSAWNFYDAILR